MNDFKKELLSYLKRKENYLMNHNCGFVVNEFISGQASIIKEIINLIKERK